MKPIGFKHQRESMQNSDNTIDKRKHGQIGNNECATKHSTEQ